MANNGAQIKSEGQTAFQDELIGKYSCTSVQIRYGVHRHAGMGEEYLCYACNTNSGSFAVWLLRNPQESKSCLPREENLGNLQFQGLPEKPKGKG